MENCYHNSGKSSTQSRGRILMRGKFLNDFKMTKKNILRKKIIKILLIISKTRLKSHDLFMSHTLNSLYVK